MSASAVGTAFGKRLAKQISAIMMTDGDKPGVWDGGG
jgi:hypothetical protein